MKPLAWRWCTDMITVTIYLEVTDAATFRQAAREQAALEGDTDFDAENLAHCAQMLLDPGSLPGARIIESSAEDY